MSVEISGVLERKLRRLVDLGIYASVAEAVRDAVRRMLDGMDLRGLALDLYLNKGASLQYVIEFSGETFDSMIDYMLSKGVLPSIGAVRPEDASPLDGKETLVDPVALHVIYRSGLKRVADSLRDFGYRFLVPSTTAAQLDVLEAQSLRRGVEPGERLEVLEVGEPRADQPEGFISDIEASLIRLASENGLLLLSDDSRTRGEAAKMGVRSLSSLSIISTYIAEVGSPPPDLPELVMSLKAVPLMVPEGLVRRWAGSD